MKKFLLVAGIVALLFACASFPEPEGQGNSLVIGSFVLDFPDGFFREPPCKFTSGVTIHVVNVTKNTNFTLTTSHPGYFYFLTNGSDEFKLDSWEFETKVATRTYRLNRNPMGLKIEPAPDKVIYLGHIAILYLKPKIARAYGDQSSTWDYKNDVSARWDKEALLQFIRDKAPESQWLDREVLEYRAKSD